MIYVPTFQGLSPVDWLRPATNGTVCFPFTARHLAFYRARNAIYHLFSALRTLIPRLDVLVPDYHSGNEVLALQAAGARLHFYRIGRDMQPDLNHIDELCKAHDPQVLYVIHYLGWPQPITTFMHYCRNRSMLVVEDCALALLSHPNDLPAGSLGDWSIFCLYKTLPVPNGALLVENTLSLNTLERLSLRRASTASVLARVADLTVHRLRARVNTAGRVLQSAKHAVGKAASALDVNRSNVGDIGFDEADADLAMSPVTARLLQRFRYDSIWRKRVANYHSLAQSLGDTVTPALGALPEGACPLFLPILVSDKPSVASQLGAKGINALQFWNHGADAVANESDNVRYLRKHVLGLPIHQDVSPRQLEYLATQFRPMHSASAAA